MKTKLIKKNIIKVTYIFIIILISGCGQKGPLYIPKNISSNIIYAQ